MRRERPRQRAAVDRLQHRRLDLDEALVVEEPAHRGDDLRAGEEQLARLLVGDQVELALAEARLGVGQAVVLLGRRAQRLGQQRPVLDRDRQLAAAGPEDGAVGADQVAEVEPSSALEAPPGRARRARACSWMRPLRSTRSRNAALPWPRRAARRPATRTRSSVSSPRAGPRGRLDVGDRARPGRRAGTARCPRRAAPRACAGGRRAARGPLVSRLGASATAYATSILVILSLRALPLGSCTVTTSSRLWPTRALPTGDSLESWFRRVGLGRADDRVLQRLARPLVLDVDERADAHDVVVSSEASITEAERSLSSSVAMRASSMACSFLASSYSEFSEMSPNSRASLMRSATSRRFVVGEVLDLLP